LALPTHFDKQCLFLFENQYKAKLLVFYIFERGFVVVNL
jgi:hypothetical protein